MFELKHKNKVNVPLLTALKGYGYDLYHLIPGLGILVPFIDGQSSVQDELNLFCCKQDMAIELERRELLLMDETIRASCDVPASQQACDDLMALPYYAMVFGDAPREDAVAAGGYKEAYLEALGCIATAVSTDYSPLVRYKAALQAKTLLTDITDQDDRNVSCLISLVRVLHMMGVTYLSLVTMERLLAIYKTYGILDPKEPFYPVMARYDTIEPSTKQGLSDWCLAQILELRELRRAFSSFTTHVSGLENLEIIKKTGFMSEDMERRQTMIKKRFAIHP
jgi:hypothetical protein